MPALVTDKCKAMTVLHECDIERQPERPVNPAATVGTKRKVKDFEVHNVKQAFHLPSKMPANRGTGVAERRTLAALPLLAALAPPVDGRFFPESTRRP